jgi:simple sugar transport system permease protein
VIALAVTAFSWLLSFQRKKVPLWLMIVFTFALVLQILVLLFVGEMFPVTQTLQGSLALSVPLIFGALAGVLSERVGVINIAIEGQLLAGAFASALIASITGSLTLGLVAAAISGPVVLHQYLLADPVTSTVTELALWSQAPVQTPWPAVTDSAVLDSLRAPLCDAYLGSCS